MGLLTQMTDKQKRAAYQKEWRNRQSPEKQEEIREAIRVWHRQNKDLLNYKRNNHPNKRKRLDRACAYYKTYRANPDNRDKIKFYRKYQKAIRRLAIERSPNPFTMKEWKCIVQEWEYRCAYCGIPTPKPTQDHIIPLSQGGEHTAQNILPACMSCNQRKSARGPLKFLDEIEYRTDYGQQ